MMGFERPGAPNHGPLHRTFLLQIDQEIGITQGRRTKPLDALGGSQLGDGAGILQRRGERLIDKERLAGFDHQFGLRPMRTAVHAFQQHGIHLREQGGNVRHDLDAILRLDLFGVLIHPIPTLFEILATSLIRRHHASAGDVVRVRRIVQNRRKGGDMRRVGADNSDPQIGGHQRG